MERAVAQAFRRVQRLVTGRIGVDDCLRLVYFGLVGVAQRIRCQGHERTVPDAVCGHGFSPANPRRTQRPTWDHEIRREPPAREAVGELAWPQGPRPVAHNLGIGITFRPRFVRYLCYMAETLALAPDASRKERYEALSNRWKSLLGNEPNRMANLANAAAVLKEAFDWHWVGFYLVDKQRDELVLGPFQGPLACTRLHHGNGVCAAAWDESTVQLVPDVHEFEGHVACSSLTESELVIPIVSADEVVAVLDIDSVKRDDVSAVDVEGLTPLVDFLGQNWNVWE